MRKGVILDLDGTLLEGDLAYPGAKGLIDMLSANHIPFLVMTNSVKPPHLIQHRLAQNDIVLDIGQILNPISAMNVFIEQMAWERVWCIGTTHELSQINVVCDEQKPEAILLLDFEYNNVDYRTLQRILDYMQRGIPTLAASGSYHYIKSGHRALDTGAFVKLLECASGQQIPILGKPSKTYFEMGAAMLGCETQAIIIVGDDEATDIAGALSVGAQGVLVKTGKFRPHLEPCDSDIWICEDLGEVTNKIRGAIAHGTHFI